MSTNEHDVEYGPNPPGAKYEHTDIDPSIGYKFAIWLVVAMLMSVGLVYGVFWYYEGQQKAANAAAQKYPLAQGLRTEPPAPRLQTQPFKDIYLLRQGEAERLESYGWVDKAAGVTRVPIERAMELTLERKLPARTDGSSATPVVEESSAGRTSARR
jgi:hypothetical protein